MPPAKKVIVFQIIISIRSLIQFSWRLLQRCEVGLDPALKILSLEVKKYVLNQCIWPYRSRKKVITVFQVTC